MKVTVNPATLLVTRQEAKDFLQLTVSTYDTLIDSLIEKASGLIESQAQRLFGENSYEEIYCGNDSRSISLDHYPVIDVDYLSYDIDTENRITNDLVTPRDYFVRCEDGLLELADDFFYKSEYRTIYVKYSAGYETIPADIKLACLNLISKKFMDITDKRAGIQSKSSMNYQITYSQNDLSDSDVKIVDKYRKLPGRKGIGVAGLGWSVQS